MKKFISIAVIAVLIGASLFFYIFKNKPMENKNINQQNTSISSQIQDKSREYVNINQSNTLESFQEFFVELHKRAVGDDRGFVDRTIPLEITKKLQELRGITRDQHIYNNRILVLKDIDASSIKYEKTDTGFSVDALLFNGEGFTWTYKNVDGAWVEYNDFLFPTPEQQQAQKNKNQYQLSLYGKGNAEFKVLLNDKEVKEFAMSHPDGKSLSALLNVKTGKNTLVIEITPQTNSDEVTYTYNIYQFPKDNPDQELIFDDTYKLFSSTPKDEKVFFAKTTKIEKLSFEINAN